MQANLFPTLYETVTILLDAPLDPAERLKSIDVAILRPTSGTFKKTVREGPTIIQLPFSEES